MRVLLQQVTDAHVKVNGQTVGAIEKGLLLYVGFKEGDLEEMIKPHAEKAVNLRIFPDAEEKMNLSLREAGGDLLVISQFTLYGDVKSGRRPSFTQAMKPEMANDFYEKFCTACKECYPEGKVEKGKFGAMMQVSSINQGPTNFLIEL